MGAGRRPVPVEALPHVYIPLAPRRGPAQPPSPSGRPVAFGPPPGVEPVFPPGGAKDSPKLSVQFGTPGTPEVISRTAPAQRADAAGQAVVNEEDEVWEAAWCKLLEEQAGAVEHATHHTTLEDDEEGKSLREVPLSSARGAKTGLRPMASGLEADAMGSEAHVKKGKKSSTFRLPRSAPAEASADAPSHGARPPRVVQGEGLALELFAGSARLTRALRRKGLDASGVDHRRNRHKAQGPVLELDLSTPSGREVVWRALKSGKVVFVSMAPPCGTGSRAREIPLVEGTFHGAPPRPLRGEGFVMGLPVSRAPGDDGLTEIEAAKVAAANELWEFAIQVAEYCSTHGILWACENPLTSWFWQAPSWSRVMALEGVVDCDHHACMHGSRRKKAQRWRSNLLEMQSLASWCDGKHVHAPWKRFRRGIVQYGTKDEAEYPWVLCGRVADCVVAALARLGTWSPARAGTKRGSPEDEDRAARQQALGKQPRRDHAARKEQANIVPEFREVRSVVVRDSRELEAVEAWKRALEAPMMLGGELLPAGTRKVSVQRVVKEGSGQLDAGAKVAEGHMGALAVVKIGHPWSKAQFCDRAAAACHPFDAEARVADNIAEAAFAILTKGPDAV